MSRIKHIIPISRLIAQLESLQGSSYTGVSLIKQELRLFSSALVTTTTSSSPSIHTILSPTHLSTSSSSLLHLSRTITSSSSAYLAASSNTGKDKQSQKRSIDDNNEGLVAAEEEFSAITDKIPKRPVTVVEGTSYTLIIVAALGFAAAVIYAALNELVFSPKEYQCYTKALDKVKDDPRVTVRLGTPISAYGSESRNRAARQRIPHRIYTDNDGIEHIQLQFHLKGPSGRATVNADMYQDGGSGGEWRYRFLYLNVESPVPQQVVLIRPGQVDY